MITGKVTVDLLCDTCTNTFGGWNEDFTVVNDAIDDYIIQANEAGWDCNMGKHICNDCLLEKEEEDENYRAIGPDRQTED